jgi:hypothetical protein
VGSAVPLREPLIDRVEVVVVDVVVVVVVDFYLDLDIDLVEDEV